LVGSPDDRKQKRCSGTACCVSSSAIVNLDSGKYCMRICSKSLVKVVRAPSTGHGLGTPSKWMGRSDNWNSNLRYNGILRFLRISETLGFVDGGTQVVQGFSGRFQFWGELNPAPCGCKALISSTSDDAITLRVLSLDISEGTADSLYKVNRNE